MSTKVKEVETTKEAKTTQKATSKRRSILGVQLSKKLPNEVVATIEVIKANKGKVNVPFNTLFDEYVKEMSKISKSKSNLKTRFRRILYRNLEGILLKNSIQSAKFNLKANIKGITIKPKNRIEYKANGDAITSTVDLNYFSFKVNKTYTKVDKLEITKELLSKVAELKK